jgi:DNA-binding CsgD family transcriptional regulator
MRSRDYHSVVEALYDAVLAQDSFHESLLRLSQASGTAASWLVVRDRMKDDVRVIAAAGVEPEFQAAYESHYQHSDPAKERYSQVPVGDWWIDSLVLGKGRIRRSAFHQEFLRAHDMASYMGTPLFRSDEREVGLSFLHSTAAGLFTPKSAQSIGPFLSHLRNAVLLRERFQSLAAAAEWSQQILERLPYGVAVIDQGCRILVENSLARGWLAALGSRRKWSQPLPRNSCSFEELLRRACAVRAPARPQAGMLHLVGRPPCYLVVLSLPATHRFGLNSPQPAALILFYTPGQRRQTLAHVLRDLFSLTPAECRLLDRMSDGSSLYAVADALHLKRETVRSMLKSAFQKTGAHSQAQLLHLVTVLNGMSCQRSGSPEDGAGVSLERRNG